MLNKIDNGQCCVKIAVEFIGDFRSVCFLRGVLFLCVTLNDINLKILACFTGFSYLEVTELLASWRLEGRLCYKSLANEYANTECCPRRTMWNKLKKFREELLN